MHLYYTSWLIFLTTLLRFACAQSIDLDVNDPESLKAAAKNVAANMMKTYTGDQPGQIPGLLPKPPYYWYMAGAMFGQLIHYWYLTGDDQYNDKVKQALLFQIGDDRNYMPANQSSDSGNDDQVFWAFSAMDAAEYNFSNPNPGQYPSWLALAQAVFNTQVPRWDMENCGGGLRWQTNPLNAGWGYKNTISNGGFFQLSARLARYTGNTTYADWADKAWSWMWQSPMMNHTYTVWDGSYVSDQCSSAVQTYYSYNTGTLLMGAAYMYDFRNQSSIWHDRIQGLLDGGSIYFVQNAGANSPPKEPLLNGTILSEIECEFGQPENCDTDATFFKAHVSRWMAITAQLAPFSAETIVPRLQSSARGAALACSGGGANLCGRRWYQDTWDGYNGVGEQLSALSVFQNNLVPMGSNATAARPGVAGGKPLTSGNGGTSEGDPGAGIGTGQALPIDPIYTRLITAGDKAGAAMLTLFVVALPISSFLWLAL